jgi:hypothetical protein
MSKKNKFFHKDPEIPAPVDIPPVTPDSPKVEVVLPPEPILTPDLGVKNWVTKIFENFNEIAAWMNELENLGFKITFFDFEVKTGGEIWVLYRAVIGE